MSVYEAFSIFQYVLMILLASHSQHFAITAISYTYIQTMFAIRVLICAVCLGLGHVSSRSMTMMSSKYLGKSPVFVAGGSNGVGLEVVKQLSSLGTPVHVLARRQVWFLTIIIHLEPDS